MKRRLIIEIHDDNASARWVLNGRQRYERLGRAVIVDCCHKVVSSSRLSVGCAVGNGRG